MAVNLGLTATELQSFLFAPAKDATSPLSCNATTLGIALAYFLLFHTSYNLKFLESRSVTLSKDDRVEWHNRLMSSLSALALLLGATLRFSTQAYDLLTAVCTRTSVGMLITACVNKFVAMKLNHVRCVTECYYGYSVYQDLACRLFVGFLAYDIFHIVRFQWKHDATAPVFLLHHVLFMVVGIYGISGSYFKFQFLWLIAGEASNPLINLRWHLAVTGNKGLLYLLNGVAVAVVFALARVVLYGYGLWHLTMTRHMWLGPDAPSAFAPIMGLVFLGYALQLYWFVLIMKALVRALSRSKHSKDE